MTSVQTHKDTLLWAKKTLLSSQFLKLTPEQALKTARLILSKLLNLNTSDLIAFPEKHLDPSMLKPFQNLIQRACQGEPVSRLFNEREFWSLPFKLNPSTLDPRPDSETLVDVALTFLKKSSQIHSSLKILDLGTGSGCLLLSLLSELPNAMGIGVDLNFKALQMAQENSKILNLSQRAFFIQSFWANAFKDPFDIIVCNPPYIKSSIIPVLEPVVRLYDPSLALDGGADGLTCYKHIIPQTKHLLNSQGLFLLEIGATQAQDVETILKFSGFKNIALHHDLESRPRVLSINI